MALELKHLAAYLPYNLKCRTEWGIMELSSLKNIKKEVKVWFETSRFSKNFNNAILRKNNCVGRGFHLSQVKPVLRPLTDLIKEIQIGKESFIPICKLASLRSDNEGNGNYLYFNEDFSKKVIKVGERDGLFYCQWSYWQNSDGIISEFSFCNKMDKFGFGQINYHKNANWLNQHRLDVTSVNQLHYFEYLFAWHFDVFGLIEKGLAIDINTEEL